MKRIKHIVVIFLIFIMSMYIVLSNNITIQANEEDNLESQVNEEYQDEDNLNIQNGQEVIVQSTANETLPTSLQNGGFEEPVLNRTNSQVDKSLVPYWDTTAYGNKIEMFKDNTGVYIPGVRLTPREGKQAAELNADENSTLFQYISTEEGKTYEWGLSHRGRKGIDTMALIIGREQAVNPSKPAKAGKDQFMKMGDWLKAQVDIDVGLDIVGREIGCSKKIILYSKTFAARGSFTGGDTDAFSWTQDEVHTEEWNVWLMTSNNNKWEDFGSASENTDYDFTYDVPEGSPISIFAFSAIQTADNNTTAGNFLDNINFKEYYNVEVYTTPGGTGTYIYNGETNIDYYNNYTGNVLKNENFTVIAHELTGTDFRKFIGANINNEFVDVLNFVADGTGNYTYSVNGVDKHYKIRLIFSGGFITYDINVGRDYVSYDDYHYDGTNNTNYEVPINSVTLPSYTSHATSKYNNDGSVNEGWRFIGWKYANEANNIIFDGVHTVNYVSALVPGELDTLTISGNVVGGGQGEISNIPADNGAVLVAQWKYCQGFIPRLWDINTKTFKNSGEGGIVSIRNVTSEIYEDVGKAYFADNNEFITATATSNEGYEFRGWHNENGDLISPNASYTYQVIDGMVKTSYAYFVKVHNLSVNNEVNGNLGNRDKYFNTTIHLNNLEVNKTFVLTYTGNGTQSNPTSFTTDQYGNATVRCKLKDNGCINLIGLLEGSTYRVLEDNYSSEGYSTTGTVLSNTALLQDTSVTVINTKNAAIPLGVQNDDKPYLCMALVSMACLIIIIIFYINKRHKKSKE